MNHKKKLGKKPLLFAGALAFAVGAYALSGDSMEEKRQKMQAEMQTALQNDPATCGKSGYELFRTAWQSCSGEMQKQILTDYKATPSSYAAMIGLLERIKGEDYQQFSQQHQKDPTPKGLVAPQRLMLEDTVLQDQNRVAVLYDQQTDTRYLLREEEILGEKVLTLSRPQGLEEKTVGAVKRVKDSLAEGYKKVSDWIKE